MDTTACKLLNNIHKFAIKIMLSQVMPEYIYWKIIHNIYALGSKYQILQCLHSNKILLNNDKLEIGRPVDSRCE